MCYSSVADHFSKPHIRANLKKPSEDYSRIYGADGINHIIKTANENGFFVCYNHPRWSLENYGDYCGYEGLWGVEIYNTSVNCGGLYDYDINVADDFLRDGKRVFVSCGDDNHNPDGRLTESFGAFVMVNADKLTYASIIDGLLSGNFYSSTGPLIHELYTRDGKVYVSCSEAKQICLSTCGRRSDAVISERGDVAEAVFDLQPDDVYFRIDVIDSYGRRANTQAYFWEELKW